MIGKFKDKCYKSDSWRKDGTQIYYADMWIMDAFDCNSENPLSAKRYEILFPEIDWHKGSSGVLVEETLANELLEAIQKDLIKAERWTENDFQNFMKWDFENESNAGGTRPTAEDLADGKILLSLKEKYLNEQNEENLIQVICCLRDSVVRVPMHMELNEKGLKHIEENLAKGITETPVDENTTIYPMLITNDKGEKAIPVFSTDEEVGKNYDVPNCGIFQVSLLDCITFAKGLEGCVALVLDPFTKPFVINMGMAEAITQIRYEDEVDGEQV